MRKSILVISMLSALFMAVTFNVIKNVTGIEFDVLLYAAIATMIIGLYKSLYTNNKTDTEEES